MDVLFKQYKKTFRIFCHLLIFFLDMKNNTISYNSSVSRYNYSTFGILVISTPPYFINI